MSRRRAAAGFSSLEALAAIPITLGVLSTLYVFQQLQLKKLASQSTYSDAQNTTRTAIDVMTRELRMATYDPGTAISTSPTGGCAPGVKQGIAEATPTRIHFRQDLNGDGTIAASGGEDVTYDLVGGAIHRTDGTGAATDLVSGIPTGGFGFVYFDASNPPAQLVPSGSPLALNACQRDSVAKVRIAITAQLANPDPHGHPLTSIAESEVAIRNRSLTNF